MVCSILLVYTINHEENTLSSAETGLTTSFQLDPAMYQKTK